MSPRGRRSQVIATSSLVTLVAALAVPTGAQGAVTERFGTGASTFVVPAGITSLQVHAVGGQGSRGYLNAPTGGRAAVVDGTLAVTPGSTWYVRTAGNGRQCGFSDDGAGFNGGGRSSSPCAVGGGGGGASDLRTASGDLGTRALVAAGGGGAGDYGNGADAGAAAAPDTQGCSPAAQPGTAVAGGAGGAACGANPIAGGAGTFGQGGVAGQRSDTKGNVENTGGGGGGGWYGGGGGTVYGGGAGGSNHTTAAVTGVQTSLAARGSTPEVTLTYPGPVLRVTTAGAGSGHVSAPAVDSSAPAALDCGRGSEATRTACAKELRPGASVTLTATPAPGSTFEGFTGDCVASGTTCTTTVDGATTVTATFGLRATLTVVSAVTNDDGGIRIPSSFEMRVAGGTVSTPAFPGSATGTTVTLDPGPFSVTSPDDDAYARTPSAGCSRVAADGQALTCTITHDDRPGTLAVVTDVVNDDGGTRDAGTFTTRVTGTGVSDDSFPAEGGTGTSVTLDAGTFGVALAPDAGYAVTYSSGCSGSVANGATAACRITADDRPATLTVVTDVVNDHGGTATPGSFATVVTGTDVSVAAFPGAGGAGTTVTLDAGAFAVEQAVVPGYATTRSPGCNGTLAPGASATCTIGYDDVVAPVPAPAAVPPPAAAAPSPPVAAPAPVCVSRRVFRVTVRRHLRKAMRSAVVTLDGRRIATLRGGRTSTIVSLVGRRRSIVTVRLTVRLKSGRRVVDVRRYRPCREA